MTREPFDLDRFVAAQQPAIGPAQAELAAGRKRSHWMWFVFPQLKGLGTSATALRYGLASPRSPRRGPTWLIRCWGRGCAIAPGWFLPWPIAVCTRSSVRPTT